MTSNPFLLYFLISAREELKFSILSLVITNHLFPYGSTMGVVVLSILVAG